MNLGKLMVWQERLRFYVSAFQIVLLVFLSVKAGLSIWIVIAATLCLPFILFIDIKFILPQYSKYYSDKNPFLTELKADIKQLVKIEKRVGALEEIQKEKAKAWDGVY